MGYLGNDTTNQVIGGEYTATQQELKNEIDLRIPEIENYSALREYSGTENAFYVICHTSHLDGGNGIFRRDDSDTTSLDNGGTIIVDSLGRRWKREYEGNIFVDWFGAIGVWGQY